MAGPPCTERPSTSGQRLPRQIKGADGEGEGRGRWSRPHLPENVPEHFRDLSSHCSLLSPVSHLVSHSGDLGSLDRPSLGRGTQGNLRPQVPRSDQEEPGSGSASPACRALGDGRGHTVSTVQGTPGPAAPSPGAEDDTPATLHKGLCGSYHRPVLAAHALPPHQQGPWLREAHPVLLLWLHSLAWLPTTT